MSYWHVIRAFFSSITSDMYRRMFLAGHTREKMISQCIHSTKPWSMWWLIFITLSFQRIQLSPYILRCCSPPTTYVGPSFLLWQLQYWSEMLVTALQRITLRFTWRVKQIGHSIFLWSCTGGAYQQFGTQQLSSSSHGWPSIHQCKSLVVRGHFLLRRCVTIIAQVSSASWCKQGWILQILYIA